MTGLNLTETFVETPSGQIFARTAGSGPPLLLLHGLAASSWSWTRAVPFLAERFTVCAIDLLGHGRSEKRPDTVAIEHHALATSQLLDWLDASPVYVAGIALGGLVGLELAVARPDLVRGLLLVGPPCFIDSAARLAWLASRTATFVGPDGHATTLTEGEVRRRYLTATPEVVERVNQERKQAGLWALHDLWAIAAYDSLSAARRLAAPTITCFGAQDLFIAGRPVLMAATPTAEHVLLPEAGHYPAWDAPEETARLAERLLQPAGPVPRSRAATPHGKDAS